MQEFLGSHSKITILRYSKIKLIPITRLQAYHPWTGLDHRISGALDSFLTNSPGCISYVRVTHENK
jgi:hypothetical protein